MVASAILIGSYSAALAAVSASSTGQPVPPPRVVLTFLVDDLGFWDSSVYNARSVTPVLRSLADNGVRLSRMYTYKYCSPTRRSLLSGRFPVHLSGAQAPVCSDYLPLNMTLLSRKLQEAGVVSHFIGKGVCCIATVSSDPVPQMASSPNALTPGRASATALGVRYNGSPSGQPWFFVSRWVPVSRDPFYDAHGMPCLLTCMAAAATALRTTAMATRT
jgi:hypothetical protein